MLAGQIRNAKSVFKLQQQIPHLLGPFLGLRAKENGMTLVSFFDFAPMRGRKVTERTADRILKELKDQQELLTDPEKSKEEKKKALRGFPSKKPGKGFLEEDVQAFLIREIINPERLGDISQRICEVCDCQKLKYLASEFEWSLNGKKDRIDILCRDQNDPSKIVIIELKKVRITQLKQARYIRVFQEHRHQEELKSFVAALTGYPVVSGALDIRMVYLMPDHPRLNPKEWEEIVCKNHVDGIVFYNQDFSPGNLVKIS